MTVKFLPASHRGCAGCSLHLRRRDCVVRFLATHRREDVAMTTDYDPIGDRYKRSKQRPWRAHIDCFTLLEIIGPVQRLAVLDVACGEGFYTRLLRHRGAASVTGVDLSERMIAIARRQEAERPLGIEYV